MKPIVGEHPLVEQAEPMIEEDKGDENCVVQDDDMARDNPNLPIYEDFSSNFNQIWWG